MNIPETVFLAVASRHDPELKALAYAGLRKLNVTIVEWDIRLHGNKSINVSKNMEVVAQCDALIYIPDIDFVETDEEGEVGRGLAEMHTGQPFARFNKNGTVSQLEDINEIGMDDYRRWSTIEFEKPVSLKQFLTFGPNDFGTDSSEEASHFDGLFKL